MNKLFIKGNLTRDPEMRDVNGKKLCRFSVACTNRVRAGQGEFKDEVVYLDVTTWEKQAERCSFLRKGSGVFITGRLKEEVWTDKKTQEEKRKYVMHPESIDFIAREPQRGENVGQVPAEFREARASGVINLRTTESPAVTSKRAAPYVQPKNEAIPNLYEDSDLPF